MFASAFRDQYVRTDRLETMSQLDVQGMEEEAMQFPKQSADHNQRA